MSNKKLKRISQLGLISLLSIGLLIGLGYWLSGGGIQTAVAAPNNQPARAPLAVQANDDSYTTTEDIPLTVISATGVLSNDVGGVAAVIQTAPANGSVNLNSDGGFTYTPTLDYTGVDTFTYLAGDGPLPAIAHWPFDDEADPTADMSGLGHDIALNNNVTFTTDVPPALGSGHALDFNNETVVANDIGNDLHGEQLTFAFWTKINALGWYDTLLNQTSWRFSQYQTSGRFNVYTFGLSDNHMRTNGSINDGQWHHIAFVYDGSQKTIYIDGNVDKSESATGSINRNENWLILGNSGFDGQMDEVRIYPVGLSQSEVQDVMNNNTPPALMDRATVTMTITSVNDAPVAVDDVYETTVDDALVVAAPGVLANDIDVDLDTLSATVDIPPAIGTLALALNGGFTYTPLPSFTGLVTYTYIVSDGMLMDTATVTITVRDRTCYAYVDSSGQTFSGGTAQAVQNALTVAQAGDLIKIAGYCPIGLDSDGGGASIILTQSVTLQGGYTNTNWMADPDPDLYPTLLDGRNLDTVISGTNINVTLSDLTITGGAAQNGGGVYLDSSTAVLSNTLLISNTATSNGGGLYSTNSIITIRNSRLFSNTANRGGGLYLPDGSVVIEKSSEIGYNTAANNGGGIGTDYGMIYITDSTVSHNAASNNGGGVYSKNNGVIVGNSLFEYNQASSEGGAIWVETSSTVEGNSLIRHNMAEYGGGVYADEGMLALDSSTIYSNTAASEGGAIYLDTASSMIKQSIISANYAEYGGGVFTDSDYPFVYVVDSHIVNNRAVMDGGGLHISDECSVYMERSTLSGNQAANGGGLYLNSECALEMVNSTVSDNTAVNGGGLYIGNYATTDIEYSSITNNSATVAGGGVFLYATDVADESYFTMRNSILAGNNISGTLNHASADCLNVGGLFVSGGHNLVGDGAGCPADATYDQTVTPTDVASTVLFPLADNGGAVLPDGSHAPSHALRDGSPAVDMGSDLLCPTSDQTGATRAQGNGCDVGANESAFSQSPFAPVPNLITVTAFTDDLTDNGNCTLREAVQSANTDTAVDNCNAGNGWDTVVLSAGVYSLTLSSTDEDLNLDGDLDVLTDSLTIQGAGEGLTIIDANQDGRVIEHSHDNLLPTALFLHDLTLTNGVALKYGGCLRADSGLTILVNAVVSQCTLTAVSGRYGGGIYSYHSAVSLLNSTVMNSGPSEDGGGIYIENGTLSLYDSLITGNSSEDGGGIYIEHTHLLLDNSDILSNTAADYGGGYSGNEAGLLMRNGSLAAYNVVTNTNGDGGGMYLYSGGVIEDSVISHNSSADSGGGIYADDGGIWINNSRIEYNQVAGDAGGLYLESGGTVLDSAFEGNSSDRWGGGLHTDRQTLIRDTTFYSNTADYGGGLSNNEGGMMLFNTDIRWNSAITNGGGIYGQQGGVGLINSTVSGNSADVAGGMAVISGTLSLDFSTVADNTAVSNGGGIYNGQTAVIQNSIVAGNSVNGDINHATADCQAIAPISFAGYSLFGNGTGCAATGLGDQTVDPATVWTAVIAPLADNGGPSTGSGQATWTHALRDGSPALDVIPAADCDVAVDQRGVKRPFGSGCDVGAYEEDEELFQIYLPLIMK